MAIMNASFTVILLGYFFAEITNLIGYLNLTIAMNSTAESGVFLYLDNRFFSVSVRSDYLRYYVYRVFQRYFPIKYTRTVESSSFGSERSKSFG